MARSSKPRPLGEIMSEIIKGLGPSTRFAQALVIATWQDISGDQVQRVTESVWIDSRKLYVKLNSASWRQELHLQRRGLCERLNEELGRSEIDEIIFR
jgi:predicted nucleic acid-binding Zn ribbon protein